MSNTIKIELIAALLHANGHEVELISQGEVIENTYRFYPSLCESETFHPDIPVYYASALPIRRLNGIWSSLRTLYLFKARHRLSPYDLVIIFNLKGPQTTCANYAIRHLGLPVILEYEDDRFVNVVGETVSGFVSRYQYRQCARVFASVSGCMAVSPHLLSQVPDHVPKMLLRGVVGDDIVKASERSRGAKKNRLLFSGTHVHSNGVVQLIEAWRSAGMSDWELHITGYGEMTDALRQMAATVPGVVFHGLVSRQELVELMASAKICINPHAVSRTPGNVFAFKLIEYIAAGAHVVTTPMGTLEEEVEGGITYMPNNDPHTIAATLRRVIHNRTWERCATRYVSDAYGPAVVAKSLDTLLRRAVRAGAISAGYSQE